MARHLAQILISVCAILGFLGVHAAPILPERSAAVAVMTASQEELYTPAALFASAAYCPSSATAAWSCGACCDALPGFDVYGSGGDGSMTQYWYVGYDSTFFEAIVVGHQGTNPFAFVPLLIDGDFFLTALDQTLFPGVPKTLKAHNGFLKTHARSAPGVLAAIRKAQDVTGCTKVVLTGHSLGAAIALLDSIYLPLHLPSTTSFTTIVFGLPRVGNPAFANYVDAHVTGFARITNKRDPIPILPGRSLGFAHPSNEKHIATSGLGDGHWYACSGQDNTSPKCTVGAVPNVFLGKLSDHLGPYGTITMSC